MTAYRLIELPAFEVLGKKTWISGQDNALFGRFWEQCRSEESGLLYGPGANAICFSHRTVRSYAAHIGSIGILPLEITL